MRGRPPSADKWIQGYGSNGQAALRLFCMHYAGGGASAFRGWSAALPPFVEVCTIQLPGREHRAQEPCLTSFDELVSLIGDALIPRLDLPYALFGHSMGALLSFEVTRRLQTSSNPVLPPRHLFASGCRPPRAGDHGRKMHLLPRDEFIARLRELGGTPEEVFQHEELLDLVLPIIRADFELVDNYQYRPGAPLMVGVSVYGGESDPDVPVEDLAGWQADVARTIRLRAFPGDHFFLQSARAALLADVGNTLSGALLAGARSLTCRPHGSIVVGD
jgi:medium-chain acyl-[acyl-carrier-protein] hydrolase